MTPGPLALVGGEEFQAGNEPHDRLLAEAARALGPDRPAFILATAAARHDPDGAVANARRWFARLDLHVEELLVRTRTQASPAATTARAATGSLFYLCGGDPGVVPNVLAGTPTWDALVAAWRGGAALAGSSAGAMAIGEWTLIRGRVPGDSTRQSRAGLAVVPKVAVLPHFDTFGHVGSPRPRPSSATRAPRFSASTSAPPRCGTTAPGRPMAPAPSPSSTPPTRTTRSGSRPAAWWRAFRPLTVRAPIPIIRVRIRRDLRALPNIPAAGAPAGDLD